MEKARKEPIENQSQSVMGLPDEDSVEAETKTDLSHKRKRGKIDIDSCFVKVGSKGRKKVRCSICCKFPDVVNLHKKSGHIPPICTMTGAEVRKSHMEQ